MDLGTWGCVKFTLDNSNIFPKLPSSQAPIGTFSGRIVFPFFFLPSLDIAHMVLKKFEMGDGRWQIAEKGASRKVVFFVGEGIQWPNRSR
eukprot:SAG22_NODE_1277_length_4907_cov_2.638311_8_plen_90_part_00